MAATNGVNGDHAVTGTNGVNGVNGHTKTAHVSVDEFLQNDYDYVICGGGTAGLVIAARLTENPDVTVGIIEAGKNKLDDPFVDIPAMFLGMLGNPEYDWNFMTKPQKHNKNKIHHVPRGKAIGGSSAINYMMYVRGSNADYDDWAALADDPSWDSKHMKEYMRKHQTLEPIHDSITDRSTMPYVGEHHGTSGPCRTSFNESKLPIEDAMIEAADYVTGLSKKPIDPWSGDHIGFYNTLGLVARTGPNKGKRSYAGRGYFAANQHRPNLKIVTESLVAKVILEDKTATGVEFTTNGSRHTVKAKREVIVCGGAINSPQILELSGIGDAKVLAAAGVECLVDLPSVGNDFQDHVIITTGYETNGEMTMDSIYKPEVMEAAQKALAETQGGPLTSISSMQGFFPAKMFLEEDELAEIVKSIEETDGTPFHKKQRQQIIEQLKSDTSANLQFVVVPATANYIDGVENQARIFPPPADLNAPNGITLALCLQYPVARGSIHIKSSDPTEHPEIDPGYLSHPADVAVLAAGMKFLHKLESAPSLKGKLGKRLNPSPELDLNKKEDRVAAVKDWVMGEYHVCGSCAMGSTLDSHLRVNGVKNLRVADASAFANNVSGNIVSSVYSLAEKAADILKEDWDYAALKNGSA